MNRHLVGRFEEWSSMINRSGRGAQQNIRLEGSEEAMWQSVQNYPSV